MQDLYERIINLEERYYSVFCSRQQEGALVRFEDQKISDMYSHNFTWITKEMPAEELTRLIEQEKARRKSEGKNFLMVKFQYEIAEDLLPKEHKDRFTDLEYYRLTPETVRRMKRREDLEIIKLSDVLEDEARELDELCAPADLEEFSKRRFERRLSVYLGEDGPDNYLALLEWEAVGSLDYFASEGACMLEDFVVDPDYRGQKIGTTLLKAMAETAFAKDNDLVYLTADRAESAREMYQKLGFEKIWSTSEVLYKFEGGI